MLGILILQKKIQKELKKIDKKLVKHISNPKEITEDNKKFISDVDYDGIEFPLQEKDFDKIEIFALTCLVMKMLLIDVEKPHYVYIKDFDRFMFHKTTNKDKKWFCKSCLQYFRSENVLTKHNYYY